MNFWNGKRVFITGHSGFKGAWLTLWLHHMGAKIAGYSLLPDSRPSLYEFLDLPAYCESNIIGDLADLPRLRRSVQDFSPDIVIHMAAQALVRRSYREPLSTLHTNIIGTANILESCRDVASIRSILVITTDKCYKNKETGQAYHEDDELGGRDIYSASKACAEIVAHSYRQSFFNPEQVRIATARAGNVIGAGDWSEDRLIPDAVRAFSTGETLVIRSPHAMRPWQHVVEPLSGYLKLARALFENAGSLSPAYNFGPDPEAVKHVEHVVSRFADHWTPRGLWNIEIPEHMPHEATLLALDSSRAKRELAWKPTFSLEDMLAHTARGYQLFYASQPAANFVDHMRDLFERVDVA